MTTDKDQLVARFQRWPRVVQWSALGATAILLLLAWTDVVLPVVEDWNAQADTIEDRVREVRRSETVASNFRSMQNVIVNLGPVETPEREMQGAAAFQQIVNQVMQNHNIRFDFTARVRGKLPKNALVSLARGANIDRLIGDLKFTATPSTALAILAELEGSSHVAAVTNIRLGRDTAGKIKVQITLEAWVLSSASSSRSTL